VATNSRPDGGAALHLGEDVSELEVSVVVETFTHGEGSGLDRVAIALQAATAMVEAHGAG
jgi:hypothetical protein